MEKNSKNVKPVQTRQKSVTLEFCRGSNEGEAIYLQQNHINGGGIGYRVAGPKCWGYVKPVRAFKMSEDDLKKLISEARYAIKFLKKKT